MLSLFCTIDRVAKCLLTLFVGEDVNHMLYQDLVRPHLDPRSKLIDLFLRGQFLRNRTRFIIGKWQFQAFRKGTELSWMNEVAFGPRPSKRQWCANSFPKISLILRPRGFPRKRIELFRWSGCFRYANSVVCAPKHREIHNVLSVNDQC